MMKKSKYLFPRESWEQDKLIVTNLIHSLFNLDEILKKSKPIKKKIKKSPMTYPVK